MSSDTNTIEPPQLSEDTRKALEEFTLRAFCTVLNSVVENFVRTMDSHAVGVSRLNDVAMHRIAAEIANGAFLQPSIDLPK